MDKRLDPNKAFPDEVLKLHREQGVPLPAFFAGPLYTGNGPLEALEALNKHREAALEEHRAASGEEDQAAFGASGISSAKPRAR